MWALMSLGMMLPTAFPALQRFAILVQNRRDGTAALRFLAFVAAYALIWLGFSGSAALLHAAARLVGGSAPMAAWLTRSVAGRRHCWPLPVSTSSAAQSMPASRAAATR